MGGFKQMKTAKLGIVLQVTEEGAGQKDDRAWVVHDVERNRGFKVTLSARALNETPPGEKSKKWAEGEIEGAIGLAIERFLTGSAELVAGPLYDVKVTSRDLYEYAKLRP
jgi:hypothetical protein